MRNTFTVTQTFPSWAAAYEARGRLAEDDGFDRYGIDGVEIGRLGREFQLLIHTDEFHSDEIEHLLRSSGTMFNAPARAEGRGWASGSLLLLGVAGAVGVGLYAVLSRPRDRRDTNAISSRGAGAAVRAPDTLGATGTPMFTLEINGTPIAVTKGNRSEARAIFEDAEFKRKLRIMESNGKPLWNGTDHFTIRPATRPEIRALVEYADKLGFDDEEEGEVVLYLNPIDTPDEFDETQDG